MELWIVALLTGLTLFTASVATLIWAWRGKKIDDHPLCRKCGFDLTGKPESSTRCAECGRDLLVAGAVRLGHRERRAAWTWISGGLIVFLISAGSGFGVFIDRYVDLTQYKPLWLIERDFECGSDETLWLASAELDRRLLTGEVNGQAMAPMVEWFLRRGGKVSHPWDWDRLICRLRKSGGISDGDWMRLLRMSAAVELRARARVNAGDAVPIEGTFLTDEWCWFTDFSDPDALDLSMRLDAFLLGDAVRLDMASDRLQLSPEASATFINTTDKITDQRLRSLPPGEVTLRIRATAEYRRRGTSPSGSPGPVVCTEVSDQLVHFAVCPRAAPAAIAVPVSEGRPIWSHLTCVTKVWAGPEDHPGWGWLIINLEMDPSAVGLSHRAKLVCGAKEVECTTAQLAKGSTRLSLIASWPVPAGPYSVVLTPDPSVAAGTMDVLEYARDTIVIDGVHLPAHSMTSLKDSTITVRAAPTRP